MGIGKRLRKIRTQQNLTARQLSDASGVPEKTIYRIETGEVQDPKLSSIEPLIRTLNCSADELLFDLEQFTALEGLRRAFAQASELNEADLDFFQELIRKVLLATSIENHVSDQFRSGKTVLTQKTDELNAANK